MPVKQEDKDNKPKSPKRRSKRIRDSNNKKKGNYKINKSDSSSDEEWVPEDSSDHEQDIDTVELQKFIQKIFPSKAGKERLKQLEKIDEMMDKKDAKKKKIKDESHDENAEEEPETEEISDDDDDDEYDEELVIDDDDDEYDEEELKEMLGQNMKFNIIFTVGDVNEGEEDDEEEDDEEEEEDDENPNDDDNERFEEECKKVEKAIKKKESSDKKKNSELEKFKLKEKVLIQGDEWDEEYSGVITKVCTRNRYNVRLDDKDLDKRDWKLMNAKYIRKYTDDEKEYSETMNEIKKLVEMRKNKGNNAMIKQFEKMVGATEKHNKKKEMAKQKKLKTKNMSKFRKMLREKNVMNDFKYFKELDYEKQNMILMKLKEVNEFSNVEKPYRLSLIESDIPIEFKSVALKKINVLQYMDPGSGEYYKIKQWVDTFMRIPFSITNKLPVSIADGRDSCSDFMENAKKTLDECVYGLNDAKMQIMQFVGQWIANPDCVGSAIAIKGPPGTGKTTLIKEGISKILNRPFSFIALGGATDSSFLEGHSYTYEGSTWGKIVDILLQSKTMNPVIYFDELDKISDTPKGEEITGILTHLTDTTQNSQFHDKYFSNIDFDLSKVLFIFSYNEESKVNPILKDRMYRIHTKGYDTKEKYVIANDYLIPKIEKNVNFEKGKIIIPEETLSYIINEYTEKEKGVRNLKRCLEILYTKINLYTLMKPDSKLFDGEEVIKIEYPFTITESIVKKLIKKNDSGSKIPFGLYL